MVELDVDAILVSVGADLPWLSGYEAMPLERLTMLVLTRDDLAVLVVPELEAPRVTPVPDAFRLESWAELDDPVARVVEHLGGARSVAVGDQTWATFVLALQQRSGVQSWRPASEVTGALRAVKDDDEISALAAAASAADRVAAALQAGEVGLVGRREADVSAELGRRLIAEGHHRVNFAIVASGPNAASPHHEPGARRIEADEVVLCDFGGTMIGPDGVGYCSDITRCVVTGEVPAEVLAAYGVLEAAQAEARDAASVGRAAAEVDAAARAPITEAGFGTEFVHRTGHGIGIEAHEHPYIVGDNDEAIRAGHAFSVEPGIYRSGQWGLRLEDIVVATDDGPRTLNGACRDLVGVDG